jgi:hypothetical protein
LIALTDDPIDDVDSDAAAPLVSEPASWPADTETGEGS